MAIVRKHIYFSGQVQGVGFRYRAKNAARANDLTKPVATTIAECVPCRGYLCTDEQAVQYDGDYPLSVREVPFPC